MAEIIVCAILSIPIYGYFIWSYFYPEESFMLGKRGMFKEEPEISEGAIRYTKGASLVSLVVITLGFIIAIIVHF